MSDVCQIVYPAKWSFTPEEVLQLSSRTSFLGEGQKELRAQLHDIFHELFLYKKALPNLTPAQVLALGQPQESDHVEKTESSPGGYTEAQVKALFTTRQLSDAEKVQFTQLKASFEAQALHVLRTTPMTRHQTIAINKIIEAKDAACLGFITAGL